MLSILCEAMYLCFSQRPITSPPFMNRPPIRIGLCHSVRALMCCSWTRVPQVVLPAIRLYHVQEMIAALIMFSVLFVGAFTVVLIIFLLDRASQHLITWAEAGVARVVHRVVDAVEGITASPVWAHRFRKEKFKGKRIPPQSPLN